MRKQRIGVKRRPEESQAIADILDEDGRPEVVERLMDQFRQLPASRRRSYDALIRFLGESGVTDDRVIGEMLSWDRE